MNAFRNIGLQLREQWTRWSTSERLLVVGAVVAGLIAVIGVGVWSTQSEFAPVADHLGPAEAAEVISTLEASQIDYELNYAGSTVSVPKQDVARARLALRDIVSVSADDSTELGDSLWSDPSLNRVRVLRQRELRLEHSIAQLTSIAAAKVHLSLPESSPFIRDQHPASASIILTFSPGFRFSPHDAAAVVTLVSHSVEGLDPSQVTVVDTEGHVFSEDQGLHSDVSSQLEFRRSLESELSAKAQGMLSQVLGMGRALVRVTADVDFTHTERQEISYDQDGKVKLTETLRSEKHTGAPVSAGGAVGTSSNTGVNASLDSPDTESTTIEENTTEFANAESRDTIRELPGKTLRLTVAAVVDLSSPDAGDDAADSTDTVAVTLTQEQVEGIIKQAVGFDKTRGDEIEVVISRLAGAMPLTDPALEGLGTWTAYESIIRNASLGLASLVALLVVWLSTKRMRPITVEQDTADTISIETARRLAELTPDARDNPELVARILSAWVGEPTEETTSPPTASDSKQQRAA